MKLSAIIITKNEEVNIERALASVAFADERIVVDAQSTDRTVELATAAGAQVFINPWPGYGEQKNFGADKAQGSWLLYIDADEEVTPELKEEILAAISNPQPDFYWLKIVTVFIGHSLKHLYGHNPRLFKKAAGTWTLSQVHEQVETRSGEKIRLGDKQSAVLNSPLWHHSHKTVKSYLARMHVYAALDAKEMVATGKHRSGRPVKAAWWLPLYLSVRQSLKLLFYRRGILDGPAGWLWCVLSGYYEFVMARFYLRNV